MDSCIRVLWHSEAQLLLLHLSDEVIPCTLLFTLNCAAALLLFHSEFSLEDSSQALTSTHQVQLHSM